MTAPIPKRADQLIVGDRIAHHRLPSTYAEGPGEVVFVKAHTYRGHASVFVAYVHGDGYYDSTAYLPDSYVEVFPAADPTGLGHSRADDPETTEPIAERPLVREGGLWTVQVAGGGIEVDPPEGFVPASVNPAECKDRWHRGTGEARSCPTCGFES